MFLVAAINDFHAEKERAKNNGIGLHVLLATIQINGCILWNVLSYDIGNAESSFVEECAKMI